MELTEVRESINKLGVDMAAIMAKAREEKRELTSDEESKFDAMDADREKALKVEKRLLREQELNGSERRSEPNPIRQDTRKQERGEQKATTNQYDTGEAMRAWLLPAQERTEAHIAAAQRAGVNLDASHFKFKLSPIALRSKSPADLAEWRRSNEELRAAMGTTSGAVGGYSVPDATMQAIEVALLAFGGMRNAATVMRTDTGAALPFPTTDDTANKGVILAENTQVSETDPTMGQTVLDSYLYSSKSVLVSLQLLQDSSVNVPELIGRLLGERIGRIQNDHFTTGTGVSQPNGIVTAATASGVTFAAVAAVTFDEMVNLEHSVDPAYRANAKWMFHDGGLKMLKKVKALQYSGDLTGMPIWVPGLAGTNPDTILGYPYVVNQSMTTPATGVKSILFGDLSKYIIRDVREITLVRLNERYADYHQVGFLAFARSDGDLLDAGTHPVKYGVQA